MRKTLLTLMVALVLLGGLVIQAHAQFRVDPGLNCYDWHPTVNENEPISISERGNACIGCGNTTYTWTQTSGTPVVLDETTWRDGSWQYTQI